MTTKESYRKMITSFDGLESQPNEKYMKFNEFTKFKTKSGDEVVYLFSFKTLQNGRKFNVFTTPEYSGASFLFVSDKNLRQLENMQTIFDGEFYPMKTADEE